MNETSGEACRVSKLEIVAMIDGTIAKSVQDGGYSNMTPEQAKAGQAKIRAALIEEFAPRDDEDENFDIDEGEVYAINGAPIRMLALCEQRWLTLSPDALYQFYVDENCNACKALEADVGEDFE